MSQNQAEEIQLENKLEDITGITCIYVPVQDVYESVEWYRKNLGCRQPRAHEQVKPGSGIAILRFPDHGDKLQDAGLRTTVPAMFLVQSNLEGGRLGFTHNNGDRAAVGCFITPRIQELYKRFKQNGVRIVSDIPEGRECGPNFQFYDLDGNLWEVWQP
ncbi:VOC family protein [Paenibacillus eucommiae]|uniref:Catechol 2,3-dioxygenase-like lactoylglutathione lyase family enzyme n=1 Tax=Paenibacillus eucommiae TaxID=1355755 RepID=A0ABS4JB13_9BACL|nr:VOC family protein [Paenibacillus eucommiae]MBP1997042.1 catechol 2,3-dioxygenase-like lactoylglutathione lyase family enzyme [Paenibacillus eucommiae]